MRGFPSLSARPEICAEYLVCSSSVTIASKPSRYVASSLNLKRELTL